MIKGNVERKDLAGSISSSLSNIFIEPFPYQISLFLSLPVLQIYLIDIKYKIGKMKKGNFKANLKELSVFKIINKCALTLVLFIVFVSTNACENKGGSDKEQIVYEVIQNDTLDKSLVNLRVLIETGNYFGNTNYSLENPHDGYVSSKDDSDKKTTTFTFNPKIDFEKATELGYLEEDSKNGKITDYKIIFEMNEAKKITRKRSIITYSKVGEIKYDNDSVPNLLNLLNSKIISEQKKIHEIQNKSDLENQQLIDKMNEMDNSDFWNDFDPSVKERIYFLVQKKDCNGLQKEFDAAEENLKSHHSANQSSSKHLSLMDFIDNKMKEIDCY